MFFNIFAKFGIGICESVRNKQGIVTKTTVSAEFPGDVPSDDTFGKFYRFQTDNADHKAELGTTLFIGSIFQYLQQFPVVCGIIPFFAAKRAE